MGGDEEVADCWGGEEAGEGESIGKCVDIFSELGS